MHETDELCPLAHGLLCSICDNAAWDMLIRLIIHGLVLGAGHKAKRLVLLCINGVSSNPVEGRTKIWQLKDLILTLFGLFFRHIYLRNNNTVFEELWIWRSQMPFYWLYFFNWHLLIATCMTANSVWLIYNLKWLLIHLLQKYQLQYHFFNLQIGTFCPICRKMSLVTFCPTFSYVTLILEQCDLP
jgi:hypothetical protein